MNAIRRSSNSNYLRIARNAVSLFSESVIARVSNFVFTLVVVRHLAAFDFGYYSAMISLVIVSGFLAEFGISQVLVREIAQQKERSSELFSGAVVISLPLFVIIMPCAVVAAIFFGYPQSFVLLLAFAVLAIIGNTLVLLAGAVLRAHERMGALSLMNSGVLICSAVLGIIWVRHGAGVRELIILFVATPTINAASLLFYVQRNLAKLSLSKGLLAWRGLFGKAVPLAIFNLCGIILLRFDILLLSRTGGMVDAGIYSAARNITDSLALFIQSIIGAVFPFVAVKWKESAMNAVRNYEQTLRILTIFGMAATVGVFLLSDKIVQLLYNDQYLKSAVCLKILIWSFMLTAVGGPVSMILIVTADRLKHYIPYALGVTAMSVALNIWLTPRYGYYSASCIAVVSSLCLFVFRLIALGDILPVRPQWLRISWRPITASLVMGIGIWRIGDLPLLTVITFGFFTYVATLFILGEFGEEYRLLMQCLKGFKT
jgi:O-antigen/teichoic acid export membrane protein